LFTIHRLNFLTTHIQGCAKAKYLRELASLNDENINYLGIEIREEVADYVNCKAKEENVDGNLYVIGGYSAESLLPDITRCVREKKDVKIRALHIFHPDPWLKTRHLKRRIINPSFVRLLETHLPQGTAILLQTDVAELHEYHREVFEQNSKRYKFTDSEKHVQPCFDMYMKDVLTDRHRAVLNNGGEIFRSVLLEK
jgi:tRNA (guanine-N7-)-methyltransferase